MLRYLKDLIRPETRRLLLIVLIVFGALLVLCYKIGEPYIEIFDWNDAWFSIIAINHNTYGFLATKFMNVYPFPADEHSFFYYINHPSLLGVLLSLWYRVLGVYEWSTRLFAVVFSLGSIVLLYLLVRRIYNENIALLSAFFMAFLPMTSYFGRMVCFEPLVLFFILTSLNGYYLWMENGRFRWVLLMFIGFILGALTDWPSYFLAAVIPIHFLLVTRGHLNRYNYGYILAMPLTAAFLFILSLAYAAQVNGSLDPLVNAFFLRTGSSAPDFTSSQFTMWEFTIKQLKLAVKYFTPVCLFLSALWAYNYIKIHINNRPHSEDSYLFLLYTIGLLNVFVFKQAAWVHEYWQYYLSPAIALSSSIGLIYLHNRLSYFTSIKVNRATIITIMLMFLIGSICSNIWIHNSFDNQTQYDLGTTLNERMSIDESFLATSSSIGWNPQVVYYAKRYVLWVSNQTEFEAALRDPTKNYRYIVTESNLTDTGLRYRLFHNYSNEAGDGYRLFDLKHSI